MTRWDDARGATLVEALVAASLLVVLVGGVAGLLLLVHRFATGVEQATLADEAAAAALEQLCARPWTFDVVGQPMGVPAWEESPPGSLDEDVEGFHDHLDAAGRTLGAGGQGAPALVRRWAIVPTAHLATEAYGVEACVYAWPAGPGAAPLVCLATARARQP